MGNDRVWILLAKKTNNEATAEELQELELLLQQHNIQGYNYEVAEKLLEKPLGFLPEMNLDTIFIPRTTSFLASNTGKLFCLSSSFREAAAGSTYTERIGR